MEEIIGECPQVTRTRPAFSIGSRKQLVVNAGLAIIALFGASKMHDSTEHFPKPYHKSPKTPEQRRKREASKQSRKQNKQQRILKRGK